MSKSTYFTGQPFCELSKSLGEVADMMDATTITLFAHILKRVGRHPKSGKKKGGMKVHTIMRYQVGVPMVTPLPNRCNKAVPYSFAHSRRCFSDRHFANRPTSVPKPWLIYAMLFH